MSKDAKIAYAFEIHLERMFFKVFPLRNSCAFVQIVTLKWGICFGRVDAVGVYITVVDGISECNF